MAIANQCKELAALITQHTNGKGDGFHKTTVDGLEFQRESSVSAALCGVSEPLLAILVQAKRKPCWVRKPIVIARLSI